ncbi:hypothetical protein M427DRAFT_275743 [Gonapodya prolifera JEL478]|uniref:Uncharacterized protein n=1 Tax=Gonapodya prolifera (strain JEL478) TaxID=1344416 RepID=A0A139AY57_GONPJ|nr:hypothetical protein M427DRAFT_275743 [Gonapodya prolifera JEL478]|eukprot:KXS21650.1 hypothetical protein M427DRAFT_275743 [Gonapodya prolifera JEL478]
MNQPDHSAVKVSLDGLWPEADSVESFGTGEDKETEDKLVGWTEPEDFPSSIFQYQNSPPAEDSIRIITTKIGQAKRKKRSPEISTLHRGNVNPIAHKSTSPRPRKTSIRGSSCDSNTCEAISASLDVTSMEESSETTRNVNSCHLSHKSHPSVIAGPVTKSLSLSEPLLSRRPHTETHLKNPRSLTDIRRPINSESLKVDCPTAPREPSRRFLNMGSFIIQRNPAGWSELQFAHAPDKNQGSSETSRASQYSRDQRSKLVMKLDHTGKLRQPRISPVLPVVTGQISKTPLPELDLDQFPTKLAISRAKDILRHASQLTRNVRIVGALPPVAFSEM